MIFLFFLEIFDYFKRNQSQKQTSNFHYIDPNLLTVTQSKPSNNFFNKFDQWLEYLHEPSIDISIRHVNINYNYM
jgi:hypothetical protein